MTPPAAAALLSLPDALAPVLLARDGEYAWLALCCAGQTDTSAGMVTEVFSTSDGGRTWTEFELRGPGYGGPASLSFTGPNDGWLLFTMDPAGPARFGQLYRTDDGGRHWTLLAADVPASCDDPSLTVATTSAAWIACEPPGPLLVSRDGGTHWAPQPLPRSARGVPQFTGQTGFMTAGPASGLYLLVTHDLGRTWRRAPLPSGIGSFPDVRFLSASDGIVMPDVSPGSPVPVVYLTVNGGRTWTAVPQGLHATDRELLGYDLSAHGSGSPGTETKRGRCRRHRRRRRRWPPPSTRAITADAPGRRSRRGLSGRQNRTVTQAAREDITDLLEPRGDVSRAHRADGR